MSFSNIKKLVSGLILLLSCFGTLVADDSESSSIGNVVIPQPAKPANVEACVEPTEIMRRDHMKFLFHQRDQTVIEGVRSKKYSLTGCIDCHAQPTANGEIIRSDNSEHFCSGCHLYTSVKIDCFECHADRPVSSFSQSGAIQITNDILANISFDAPFSTNLNDLQSKPLTSIRLADE